MARVIFATDLQKFSDGARETEVAARSYRDLIAELGQRFPRMSKDVLEKYGIAIDGVIYQTPLLETFTDSSEIIFIGRIPGG